MKRTSNHDGGLHRDEDGRDCLLTETRRADVYVDMSPVDKHAHDNNWWTDREMLLTNLAF